MKILPIALLLISCGDPPPPTQIAECADATCRVQFAVDGWKQGPSQGIALMSALNGPEERMAVARTLFELGLPHGREVCDHLGDRSSTDYCKSLYHRPHLFETPRAQAPSRTRPSGGPTDTELLPIEPLDATYAAGNPTELTCGTETSTDACAQATAHSAADRGEGADAAAACRNIAPGKLRSECMFTSAERLTQSQGMRGYDESAELCLAAGEFVPHCMSHLLTTLAKAAPVADAPDPTSWGQPLGVDRAITHTFGERAPQYTTLLRNRYWAETLALSYATVPHVTGDPLDTVPADMHAHVYAAAAYRLVQLNPTAATDLDGWLPLLRASLDARSEQPSAPRSRDQKAPQIRDRWPTDDHTSKTMPAEFYMGMARRTVGQSPETELAICILEAAARTSPPQTDLLRSSRSHADPRVAWTAARLSH